MATNQLDNVFPRVIVFDLDGTLWEPEMYQLNGGAPFHHHKTDPDIMIDRAHTSVHLIGETRDIIQDCFTSPKFSNTFFAISSTCDMPAWATELLDLYKFSDPTGASVSLGSLFGDFKEIYYSGKDKQHRTILKKVQEIDGSVTKFSQMLFFDNQRDNIRAVSALGVACCYCPNGMQPGTFQKDTTAREIKALLELHKVHPQVRNDVKRHLDLLIKRAYEEMVAFSTDEEIDAIQICHSISKEAIDRSIDIEIPKMELIKADQKCAALEQHIQTLKLAIREEKIQNECYSELLLNIKAAHDFMLHSYFREVLILRRRIRDLEEGIVYPIRKVGESMLQRNRFNIELKSRMGLETRPMFNSQTLQEIGSQDHTGEYKEERRFTKKGVLFAASSSHVAPPKPLSNEMLMCTGKEFYECATVGDESGSIGTEAFPLANSGSKHILQSPRSAHFRDKVSSDMHHNGEKMDSFCVPTPRGSLTANMLSNMKLRHMLQYISKGGDSVDAIFDYEEYLKRLNLNLDSWEHRFAKIMGKSDAFPNIEAKKLNMKDIKSPHLLDSNILENATQETVAQHTTDGFLLQFRFAFDSWQRQFFTNSEYLRQGITNLQRQHQSELSILSNVLSLFHFQVERLIGIFTAFMNDVSVFIKNIARALHWKTNLDIYRASYMELSHLKTFLQEPLFARQLKNWTDLINEARSWYPDIANIPFSTFVGDWNALVKAESLVEKLNATSEEVLVRVAALLSTQGPAKKDDSDVPALDKEGPSYGTRDLLQKGPTVEEITFLTGEGLLKELVRLRLRRAATRMRVSRLEKLASDDGDAQRSELYRAMGQALRGNISKDTTRINELLRLLFLHLIRFNVTPSSELYSYMLALGVIVPTNTSEAPPEKRFQVIGRGELGGAANNYILFNNERISIAACLPNEEGSAMKKYTRAEAYTASTSNYEYCKGVHLALAISNGKKTRGPVFMEERNANMLSVMIDSCAKGERRNAPLVSFDGVTPTHLTTMPMTQILYPAPLTVFTNPPPTSLDIEPAKREAQSSLPPEAQCVTLHDLSPAQPHNTSPAAASHHEHFQESSLVQSATSAFAKEIIVSPVPIHDSLNSLQVGVCGSQRNNARLLGLSRLGYNPYLRSPHFSIPHPFPEEEALLSIKSIFPSDVRASDTGSPLLYDNQCLDAGVSSAPPQATPPPQENPRDASPTGSSAPLPLPSQQVSFPLTEEAGAKTSLAAVFQRARRLQEAQMEKEPPQECKLKSVFQEKEKKKEFFRLRLPKLPLTTPDPLQTAQLQRSQFKNIFSTVRK